MEMLPDAFGLPAAQVIIDGLPGREIMRQQSPGLTAAQRVEDGIDQLTRRRPPGSTARLGHGDEIGDGGPLGIGQVSRIGSAAFAHRASSIGATPDESRIPPRRNPLLKHSLRDDIIVADGSPSV